ncbi:hypothetical protein Psuf_002780 [Phytohabitans suffuscus]|uniref:Uncharacterized protein n=1 Tax=Phytohabitans suffuscus TaxID=624315 RepID=A0A6F8YA36_9ACTN|nr:hypothetical protein Psuf_002780 [Phytohabitans suffuscus]
MPRRGRSTTVGKIAKLCQDRRASEIRVLGELLRREQHEAAQPQGGRESPAPR